jgi:(2R)-sulfolactate sulfo-lyase subunit beta
MKNQKVMAYRRENGRVGIRNHVVILPLDDLSNSACEKVAFNIKGCKAIPHAYGRLQFGEDLELFFRTMIGTGTNPNVAAVVVIGIETEWTNRIVEGIAKTGKPVAGFGIERHGEINTVERARNVRNATLAKFGSVASAVKVTLPVVWPPTRPLATLSKSWWKWVAPVVLVKPVRSPVPRWFARNVRQAPR